LIRKMQLNKAIESAINPAGVISGGPFSRYCYRNGAQFDLPGRPPRSTHTMAFSPESLGNGHARPNCKQTQEDARKGVGQGHPWIVALKKGHILQGKG